MWEFFIRKNRFSILLMISLLGFGYYSITAIPKESAPEVVIPVGIVTTVLPGASPLEVEALITNELERQLSSQLTDVKNITSSSRESVSNITVEFAANADVDAAIRELRDEVTIAARTLPNAAETPVVSEVDFVDQPIMSIAVAGNLFDRQFSDLASAVEDELEAVTGVSRVTTSGVPPREVGIVIDSAALARFDISVSEVIAGLQASNTTLPIGNIVSGDTSYNVAFIGDIESTDVIGQVPIANRGGQPIYIDDIATVYDGVAPAITQSRLSVQGDVSQPAITFDIYKNRGGDITTITRAVNDRLNELEAPNQLLSDFETYVLIDNGEQIRGDLVELTISGLITIVLVIFVLVIAIGWREALIAGTAIPLSFTIGFIGLYLSGNTINFISTFSLILAIGILVDSGIVVIEGINKRMKDNPTIDKTEAALLTIKAFAAPITAGTLTTVAMFAGLFIVSGVTGQFIASIPFTLISVLLASLLVALGFLPLLASFFLRRQSTTKFERTQIAYAKVIEDKYEKLLRRVLTTKRYIISFLLFISLGFVTAIALIPAGFVPVVFFAEADSEAMFIEVELPEGALKEQTDIVVRQVEEVLYENSGPLSAYSVTVGAGSVFGGGGQNEKLANIYLVLQEERTISSLELMEILRTELAPLASQADITVSQLGAGPPTGTPIGITLQGEDLVALNEATNMVSELVANRPETTNVKASNRNSSIEYVLTLDTSRAAAAGLDARSVSQTVRQTITGTEATTITSLTESIDVVVRLDTSGTADSIAVVNRRTIDDVLNTIISTPTGASIPLSSLVTVSLREATAVINHEDQLRTMSVSADLRPGENVAIVNQLLAEDLAGDFTLPDGVVYSFGGEAEDSDQAFIELFLALIVGVFLMLSVLIIQFNSFRYTFYVLSILPFSLIGILYGLALTGSTLSFPSIMGFIALTGIVVNNSILLISMMIEERSARPSASIEDIVVSASTSRLRPILLTTFTTVVGLSPLLFSDPIWVPLATAIIFGLSFSVVVTLLLIPIIFYLFPGKSPIAYGQ